MLHKPAHTSEPINELLHNRWSPRSFDPERPIHDRDITALLEAARWAPSCMNEQPWRFVVCRKADEAAAWHDVLNGLSEKNRLWANQAPLLILAVAMDHFGQTDNLNRWAAYDTGAASLSLCLQATALGMISHQMGGFAVEHYRTCFQLPPNCTPLSVIAVGYQAEAERLATDELRQREQAERTRAEIPARFTMGRWQGSDRK